MKHIRKIAGLMLSMAAALSLAACLGLGTLVWRYLIR